MKNTTKMTLIAALTAMTMVTTANAANFGSVLVDTNTATLTLPDTTVYTVDFAITDAAKLSLKGDSGIDGVNGTNGTNGVDGVDGTNGVNGLNGTNGVNGIDGTNGVDGTDGEKGIAGTNGTNGTDGVNGVDANIAVAVAIPAVSIAEGSTKAFGVSTGFYNGNQAIGIGFATKVGKGQFDVAVSSDGDEPATKVGYSVSW